MRFFIFCLLMSTAAFIGGCDSGSSQSDQQDKLAGLHGAWSSETVPVSGYGQFQGISTHRYNADGTFLAEAEFTDSKTGCHVELNHVGNYSGDASVLKVEPTGGWVEVTECNDASANAARRSHNTDELEPGTATIRWQVKDGTLSLHHEDGMERTFRRQEASLSALHGTWESERIAVSGHGHREGVAKHTFGKDGMYRWEATFTDLESRCRSVMHYIGSYTGNTKLLKANASSGEVEVTGCSDGSLNAAKRQFGEEELAAASASIVWEVKNGTLLLSHSDGLERKYTRG